jgi:small-conductance mechanosensitive channel
MKLTAVMASALVIAAGAAGAADKKPVLPDVPETLTPAEADAFLGKLTDAQARALLSRELHQRAKKQAEAAAKPEPPGLGPLLMDMAHRLQSEQVDFGQRTRVVGQGLDQLPAAVSSGFDRIFGGRDATAVQFQFAMLFAVLALAVAAAWAVRRSLLPRGLRPAVSEQDSVTARTSAGALRFGLSLLPFAAFALVALAAGNALSVPGSEARTFNIVYVAGAIFVYAVAVVLRAVLSPDSAALRPVPLTDNGARFLYRGLVAVWGITVFASLTARLVIDTGIPAPASAMLTTLSGSAVALALVFMIIAAPLALRWRVVALLYVLAVWVFWTAAVLDGRPSRAGAAAASLGILLVLPLLDHWAGRTIEDVLGTRGGPAGPLRWAMRVLFAVLLVGAANELWGFQYFEWQASLRETLVSASFDLVAAFAVAVRGWQFVKIAIDRRLQPREVNGERVGPSTRLQTLLPLARVFIVTGLIASVVMLILSGLGVNIGPLLAGAGIVGLAIGFGAQTLVRDIITGVFLILDDAFRVGEYIQSGNYKGTVESIGLRSVKLRHHRGPVYVVPFGELRGVQNLVRDWVIDKITIGVTYDTDIEKARKVVKKIGLELAANPEYKDHILQPLKMQGVEQFGDFAVQLRMKIMLKPGEKQFVIRRKAYALIKKGFDENGIKFAYPTVQVAGGGDAAIAAAATRMPGFKDGTAAA